MTDSIRISDEAKRQTDGICDLLDPGKRPVFCSHLERIDDSDKRARFLEYHRRMLRGYVEASALLAGVRDYALENPAVVAALTAWRESCNVFEYHLGIDLLRAREAQSQIPDHELVNELLDMFDETQPPALAAMVPWMKSWIPFTRAKKERRGTSSASPHSLVKSERAPVVDQTGALSLRQLVDAGVLALCLRVAKVAHQRLVGIQLREALCDDLLQDLVELLVEPVYLGLGPTDPLLKKTQIIIEPLLYRSSSGPRAEGI